MVWKVLFSREVAKWLQGLGEADAVDAQTAIDRLRREGPHLRLPHSKQLQDGLRELRFTCENVPTRITYYFDPERQAIALTTFRKQRQNERREVQRALKAMKRDQQ